MNPDHTGFEYVWNARSIRPVIAFYVVAVFLGFMGLAHFVFHSPEALKALSLALLGALASMAPGILTRKEYRLTNAGLGKRPLREKDPREFKEMFAWDEISHLVPTSSGLRYFKTIHTSNPVARFFKLHFSGDHSGELHVEPEDRERVRALIAKGIPRLYPEATSRQEWFGGP